MTVVVDEESLAAIGRWPWRRAIHATLLERLAAARPAAIAFDVIVAEPDAMDPRGDEVLARAIASAGNVVLSSPIVAVPGEGLRDIAPIEAMRPAAAAIAHPHVRSDEDGVVRSLYLMQGAQALRPYIALAALQVAGRAPSPLPGEAAGEGARQANQYLIPYFGRDSTVRRYSYLSVLRGDVPPGELEGKIVFIGTGAAGLGDEHPSPGGGRTAPMAGVEIAAQIAGALQERTTIQVIPPGQTALLSSVLILLILGSYRVLQPRASLAVTFAALILVLAGAFTVFRTLQVWMPPSATLFGILLCYPLWSWRRLEAALRYMRVELERLQKEPAAAPSTLRAVAPRAHSSDPVDATIEPLQAAIADLRDARRFIADTIESLPQALLVTDAAGHVILANSRARHWAALGTAQAMQEAGLDRPDTISGRALGQVLLDFRPVATRTWESVIDESFAAGKIAQVDARGPEGRDLIVILSPCYRASGEKVGLIINMIDVSEKREAERRREDLLRILSHDMRAPQASIITLLETRSLDPSAVDTDTLLARVGSFARRTLELADDFVRLARAEQIRAEKFVELDLADITEEACAEAWTLAHAKGIRIERNFEVEEAPLYGDRALLLRMMQNLLTNAIKFSPSATVITVSLEPQGISWLLRVADQGRGIAKGDLPGLFSRFGRVGRDQTDPWSVGLGLVMVRTVVERHRGVLSVSSEVGKGSVFSVSFPSLRKALAA